MTTITGPSAITGPQTIAIAAPVGFGTAAATDQEGVNVADVFRIVKQRKLTILVTAVVIYLLTVVATLLVWKFAPLWPSEAFFELDPPKTGEFLSVEEGRFDTKALEQLLQTEARKLKSLDLLLNVVTLPEIKSTRYYAWYDGDAMKTADGLRKDLDVSPIQESRLIRVSLETREREESRRIVDRIVRSYQAKFVQDEADLIREQTESLRRTKADLQTRLSDKHTDLARIREQGEFAAMDAERTASREHIGKLKADLSALDAQLGALEAQRDSIQGLDPSRLPLTTEDDLIIEADPLLRLWRSNVESLDIELRAQRRLGPNHRNMQQLRDRRQAFYEKEVARREELVDKVRRRRVENLEDALQQARNVQARLLEQQATFEARERELDRNVLRYQQLDQERIDLERQIAAVDGKLTEAEHAARDKTRSRLTLVQEPQLAVKMSRPDFLVYLGGGIVLAIAGAFGLAFLRELTDKAVRTPIDVARFGRMPVLGSVPLLDDEEADVLAIEHAVRLAPHSLSAETFRKVRTNLQFSGPSESQRCLLITSPSPEDGKSTVAMNLAYTLANSNEKVLLIDCNFRRPSVRTQFADTRPEGLSNLLIGQGRLDELVTRTEFSNLHVLSSGPMPPTPAELLGSPAMRALLEEARSQYDRVLLDGPPVLLISDAVVLATIVDGVVLVARADENTKGTLKRAREQLESINARVVGAVLNGARARAGGYFRQHYRQFYDYVSDGAVPAELPGALPDGKR